MIIGVSCKNANDAIQWISEVRVRTRIWQITNYFENSAMLAFKRAEEAYAGEAAKAGFDTEEDMQDYMREIRKEVRS